MPLDSKIINFLIESFLEFIKKITIKVKNEENTRILLGNFYLLSDLTYNQTIKKWNNTENNYSTKKSILQLFEEQTKKIPTQIAVVSQGIKLSYHELNVQANQLAHFLQQKYSLQGDDLIAICLDRSEQILIAILAVLKAGAAYVPLDPNNPDKRISYILQDTEAKAILANSPYQKKLVEIINYHQLNISLEIIDSTELKNKLKIYPPTNVPSNILSNNLAYIIYTSGTTGTPKGVMIEHSSLINYTLDISQRFNVENNESAILISEYIFDLGNTTLFPILINGGTIHIPSKEQATSHQFIFNYINYNDINWIKCTPLYFEFVILNLDYTLTTSFKKIILGGEICSNSLKEYLTNQTNVQVFNHYGPTETTIGCICNTDFKHGYNNIIGKPLANTVVFILDKFLNILPIGAMGELYIGGAGLARGYLNLTDLTLEKFIKNPFQTEIEKQTGKNSLLYKTGDLARYLPDGSIQYLGRNDLQVKVRGFRIELGEIENQLVKYPRIKQVIVLAREHHENKTHYLVGYYVADNRLNENKILEYLSAQLPDYMVPNILVFLDKLPLTINGKLDRKALPDPEFNKTTEYIPPRNDLERKICEMYAEVLGLSEESIGIDDNFFRLGGNSILAIKLVSQMNKIIFSDPTFHLPPIQVIEIFKHKRILDLLDSILSEDDRETIIIPKIQYTKNQIEQEENKIASLSFAQERLWFIENYEGGTNAYNIPILRKLLPNVNIKLLEFALHEVVARQEILHSLIKTDDQGNGYQEVMDLSIFPFTIIHYIFSHAEERKIYIAGEINHIFSLDKEYPIRIHLLRQKDTEEEYLLIVAHHVSFDGWSIPIFIHNVQEYYNYNLALETGDNNHANAIKLAIPELTIQYRDFAIWQKNYLTGERLTHQLKYWKNKLIDYEGLHLPTDKPRPPKISYVGRDVHFSIDLNISNQLRALAKKKGSVYIVYY